VRCRCGQPSRWESARDRRCLDCARRDLVARLPRAAGWSWSTFPRETPEQELAFLAVRRWWKDSLEGDDCNLFLHGPPGTGKSGLAWCCALADLEDNGQPDFLNVRAWLREKRARFDALRRAELPFADPAAVALDSYGDLDDVGLLVLDDLGAERPTAFALEELAGLIEGRYDLLGPALMIVTSNYSPTDLARRLSNRHDPHAGERLVSRLLEGARRVEVRGLNLRLPHTPAADVRRIVQADHGAGEEPPA
jgi:DNA replication protein DnaC